MQSPVFAQEAGRIEGVVVDHETKQPIIGARIEVLGTKLGAVADVDGNFTINGLASATYRLKVSAIEYKTMVKTDVAVGSSQSTKLVLELNLDAYQANEVVVTADQLFNKSASDVNISSNELSQEEIRRAPGAAEDVSRMVQALPGVTTATDSRNDIIVRGGSPAENFIMVDGIEVPNINHFGTQGASGGPIGMINVDFLQDVTFSAGGFPVKYEDRLSSVMDIKYRDGDKNHFTGKFDLGLAGMGFLVEGPLQDGKSSYMVSAKKSYLDLLFGSGGQGSVTAVPNYSNFNLKATYELSPTHKLALIGLGGIDRIQFRNDENKDSPSNDHVSYNGWQSVLGLTHKWLAGKNTYVQTTLSTDMYHYGVDVDTAGTKKLFKNKSLDAEVLLRSDVSHRLSPTDIVEAGTQFRFLRNNNVFYMIADNDAFGQPRQEINIDKVSTGFKFGANIQYTKILFQRLSLIGGLRYDYFDYMNNPSAISPRGAIRYSLQENLMLNFAVGLYQQAPPFVWMVGDERNRNLSYIKAVHTVAGLEYYPSEDVKITLEIFNKEYSDYPASVVNPQVSYASIGSDYGVVGLEELVSGSAGHSRGIEFFLQKKLTSDLYGLVNYSLSETKGHALDGIERSSSFDFRHVFTAILGYKFTKSLELSVKWRYTSGRPYTPIDVEASRKNNQIVLDYNRINTERFPDYHRLDIRLDKRFDFSGWSLVTYVDIQNAYNRANIETYVWNEKTQNVDVVYQWRILPVGGIKIEF